MTMRNLFTKIISQNVTLYLLIGLAAWATVDFKQAKIERLYELHRLNGSWTQYFRDGNFNESMEESEARIALRYFKLMAEVYPERIRAEELEGLVYTMLGDNRRAIESFDKVLKERPQFFWVEFEKGMALYRLGRLDQALAVFSHIASRPNEALLKAGVLPSVAVLALEQRRDLMIPLLKFVLETKEKSQHMAAACSLRLENKSDIQEDLKDKFSLTGVHPWTIFLPAVTQSFQD